MAGLIRVSSIAASRRRAGFGFTRAPTVLGPEQFLPSIEGLAQLAALVSDPALVVERSDEDAPETFVEITDGEREAIVAAATESAAHDDPEAAVKAAAQILEGLVGEAPEPAVDQAAGQELAAELTATSGAADAPAAPAAAPEPAQSEPEKGTAAPAEAQAEAVAKPRRSSGRQSGAAKAGAAQG